MFKLQSLYLGMEKLQINTQIEGAIGEEKTS